MSSGNAGSRTDIPGSGKILVQRASCVRARQHRPGHDADNGRPPVLPRADWLSRIDALQPVRRAWRIGWQPARTPARGSCRLRPTLSRQSRNRRVLFDEFALLQLRPELRRDLDLHTAVVSDNLLLAGGADNQGRGDIRRCGELQRRRPEIDAVPSRYLTQLLALFDDRLRHLVVFLAIIVPLTAACEVGVERRT